MNFIPVMQKPYPDEILYSWICHLAEENGLSLSSFADNFLDGGNCSHSLLSVEARWVLPSLYQHMYIKKFGSMKDLYLNLSTFQFEMMVKAPGQQTRYANNIFREKDLLNTPLNKLISNVKICPECFMEDIHEYGHPYFHRSHQLSGVCTCHKHGAMLIQYAGKHGDEFRFDINDYQQMSVSASIESLQAYTAYAQELFEAEINTNSYQIKSVVFSKMKDHGYGVADDYNSFIEDFKSWKYYDLSQISNISYFFRIKMSSADHITIEEVLPILMFLIPDVTELIDEFKGSDPILKMYTCPVCGQEYCSTPKGEKDGWGCPYCTSSISEQKRFEHLVEIIGQGEYQVEDEFQSLHQPVALYHKKCGKISEVQPRNFLFKMQRCPCEDIMTFEQAKMIVEANDGFKLIEFKKKTESVKIYHEECGKTFQIGFINFSKNPRCKNCEPYVIDTEIFKKRIKDLVGDEYSLIGEYKTANTPVKIRHNICGCIQEYRPQYFLSGQRCRLCGMLIRHNDLERMLKTYSSGKYVITKYGQDYDSVLNTETNEIIHLSQKQILQEINRSTPSPVLPVDNENNKTHQPLLPWDQRFQLLVQYQEEFGTVNFPTNTIYQGYKIGIWCSRLRIAFKKGKLTDEQIQKLNTIGFVWDQLEAEWMRKYEYCVRYLKETGKKKISERAIFEGEKIGYWIGTQKVAYKKRNLSEERKKKLLDLIPDIFS